MLFIILLLTSFAHADDKDEPKIVYQSKTYLDFEGVAAEAFEDFNLGMLRIFAEELGVSADLVSSEFTQVGANTRSTYTVQGFYQTILSGEEFDLRFQDRLKEKYSFVISDDDYEFPGKNFIHLLQNVSKLPFSQKNLIE